MKPLTSRQSQICALVAAGLLDKQIADLLAISESTVGFHLKEIFNRLGVRCRAAAVAKFLQSQVVEKGPEPLKAATQIKALAVTL